MLKRDIEDEADVPDLSAGQILEHGDEVEEFVVMRI